MGDEDRQRTTGETPDATSTSGDATTPSVYVNTPSENADETHWQDAASSQTAHHWRPALNRWLLTLNPGRTQDEYLKAVRYFFETPGAPQELGEITYDWLLAYRGSLAMRADRRRRSGPRRSATNSGKLGAQLSGAWTGGALLGASPQTEPQNEATGAPARSGPLSPATVNIRLTALRQFMLFAIEQGAVKNLGAEQTRSALRRLRNERRRPYQILAEDEWEDFLRAAQTPAPQTRVAPERQFEPQAPSHEAGGPWGVTRAERERLAQERAVAVRDDDEATEPQPAPADEATLHGRTGLRTAQRDYALIALALTTGLRAIELSLLDVGDLVSERRRGQTEWWLSLPDEKTKGQRGGRSLPLSPEVVAALLDYIRATGRVWENPAHRATPLFLALSRGRAPIAESAASRALSLALGFTEQSYRRLRPEQIRGVIHRVEAQWQAERRAASDDPAVAGDARHISPHALRHSAAIALLLGDEATERPPASVEHVRGWLGHFDIRTTQRYLSHLESRDQRRRFAIKPPTRKTTPQEGSSAGSSAPEDGSVTE